MEEIIKAASEDIICQGNIDKINCYFSLDYIAHAGDRDYKGHEFLKRWTKQIHSSIDKIKIKKILILSNDGQTLTWQRTMSGIHINSLRGIPASGSKVIWTEMVVSRFINDKISEEWIVSELAGELMKKQPKFK